MDSFFSGLSGRIVIPSDPFYNEARQDYNRAVQQYPVIIDYCRNQWDVSNAVIWSEQHQIPIRIRNGGHNYEGYSNGNQTLVIDVSEMSRIELDEREHLLYVQGGATNRTVYEFVSSRGYPFPGGTCPTVGISGYASGGGWGLSCRLLGLGCDSLEEIMLVDYKGKIITANRNRNEDLFWACRGAGGGNFGVLVLMTFRLPPKTGKVSLIEIHSLHASREEQEAFLRTWQTWLRGADPRITMIARLYNSVNDGLAMLARGIFYGGPEEAKRIVAPFLKLSGTDSSIEYVTFLEAVTIIGSNYPPFEKFQSASRFVLRDLGGREISQLVGLVRKRAEGSVFAGLSLYALGGKVREVGPDETAFFYRGAHYIVWLETSWEENRFAEENRRWLGARFPILASVTDGSYVNFPYNRLPDYLREYYGPHVRRLKKVKEKYDPLNVFSFPQGILSEEKLPGSPGTDEEVPYSCNMDSRGFRRVENPAARHNSA